MALRVVIDRYEYYLDEGIAITPVGIREGVPRTFEELSDVSPKPFEEEGVAYWMYRDTLPTQVGGLRGDVTLILGGLLPSGELVKTHGHYHPEGPWGVWPELYGVVKGVSVFILQDLKAEKVKLVLVREGEAVMIPPGYGHVTVNPTSEPLVTYNYVSRLFSSVYSPYKERRGAAVYLYPHPEGVKVVKNPKYEVKEIEFCKPLPLYLKEPVMHSALKPHLEEWLKCEEVREDILRLPQ